MNTPLLAIETHRGFDRFFASTEGQQYLHQQLDAALRERQNATPEPESSVDECVFEDNKWQCNILYDQFETHEIEEIRTGIWQPDYWKIECQHYANYLDKASHEATDRPGQATALAYKDVLIQNGLCADKIRQSIDSQVYWEREKEVLDQHVTRRENERNKATRTKKLEIQRRRRERVQKCLQTAERGLPMPLLRDRVAIRRTWKWQNGKSLSLGTRKSRSSQDNRVAGA